MKLLHRTIAGASLAAAAAVMMAPIASADPIDPYIDVSNQFGNGLNPADWVAPGSKYLVISPLGTARIECRGDGQVVGFYNCVQRNDKNIVSNVRPLNLPFRNLYVNTPY